MPVLEAVQTFAGITNENEFYSHHYLAEVFKGDIKDRLEAWDAQEAQHPSDAPDHEQHRAPPKRLHSWAQRWCALRGQVQRGKDEHERWHAFMQIQSGLLQALGYAPPPAHPHAARTGPRPAAARVALARPAPGHHPRLPAQPRRR